LAADLLTQLGALNDLERGIIRHFLKNCYGIMVRW
jgi:hypothetical protein